MTTKFFIVFSLFLMPTLALAKDQDPPKHYIDKGACPSEYCAYKRWTVTKRTAFHKDMNNTSPIVFHADKGEVVIGLTGNVITTEVGIAKALRATSLGSYRDPVPPNSPYADFALKPVPLNSGDIFYILNYAGEGAFTLWINGLLVGDNLSSEVQIVKEPKTEWWVKVKNKKGQIGWALENKNFDDMQGNA